MAGVNFRSVKRGSGSAILLAAALWGHSLPAGADTVSNGVAGPARNKVALAMQYESGLSVPRDYGRALTLYCEAARRGDAQAYYSLGWMYLNGRGVARDDAMAVMWLRKAAGRGVAQAANLLQLLSRITPAPAQDCPRPAEPTRQAVAIPGGMPGAMPGGAMPSALSGSGAPVSAMTVRPRPAPPVIRSVIDETAQHVGIDARLLQSVVSAESGFNPNAVSPKMAAGLMQLMPATAERFGVHDRFDPRENVRGGATYLRMLLKKYKGDLALALAAFNAGESKVAAFGGVPPYQETQSYVAKIKRLCGCGE
jgi:soluble lytic murein transglycosylase-like protein